MAECFCLCLGLVIGLVIAYPVGDYFGAQDVKRTHRKNFKRNLHQRN